ncbi:MAG TPA: ankyrin repeat domain-containing protein [Candidatus Babeliales bacterium]|nr:ankyrin repeat domain-containing protein [Candidatus Babeliales bacterium]
MKLKNSIVHTVMIYMFCNVGSIFGMQADPGGTKDIFRAVDDGRVESVKHWLNHGVDINAVGGFFQSTPLMMALSSSKRLGVLKLLLARGASLDEEIVQTIIQQAVFTQDDELLELLRARGVVVTFDQLTSEGTTVLMENISDEKIVSFLIKQGANPYVQSRYGSDAFDMARYNQNQKILQILKMTKHDPRTIFQAIAAGRTDFIVHWLAEGSDVNAVQLHDTVLMAAIKYGSLDLIKLLLNHKDIDVNFANAFGETALFLAIQRRSLAVLELLLEYGARIDSVSKSGHTPFLMAFEGMRDCLKDENYVGAEELKKIIDVLIKKGVDIEQQNDQGETFLIRLVVQRKKGEVLRLLALGANPYLKDVSGSDAFDYARAQNDGVILKFLQNKSKEKLGAQEELKEEESKYAENAGDEQGLKMPKAIRRMQHIHRAMHPEQQPEPNKRAQINEDAVAAQIETQTDYHLKKYDEGVKRLYGDVTQDPVVQHCIQKEHAAIQEGKCVFYRAEPGMFRVYQYFVEEVHRLVKLYSTQHPFIFTRFFAHGAPEETITEYMEKRKEEFGGYDQFPVPSNYNINKKYLISSNMPLFGNFSDTGRCTWYYFLNNFAAGAPIELRPFIESIFDMYGFNKIFIDQLLALNTGVAIELSSLQQITIPKNIVDKIVLLSSGFYVPLLAGDQFVKVSDFLDQYNAGTLDIQDTEEAIMLINSVYGLNPESGIEFDLYSRLPDKKLEYIKKRVQKITDEMFSEWLVKQLHSERVPAEVAGEKLGDVLKHLGKGGRRNYSLPVVDEKAVVK